MHFLAVLSSSLGPHFPLWCLLSLHLLHKCGPLPPGLWEEVFFINFADLRFSRNFACIGSLRVCSIFLLLSIFHPIVSPLVLSGSFSQLIFVFVFIPTRPSHQYIFSDTNHSYISHSTSSWSRMTSPMLMLSFAEGICIFIITLSVDVCLIAKDKLGNLSAMGTQVLEKVSGQQSVHACIWGTHECGVPMGCVCVCVCIPRYQSLGYMLRKQESNNHVMVWAEILGSQTLK